MFQIPGKLVWLRGLYIIPTVIGVVLGNKISKKMFSKICGKKSFCTKPISLLIYRVKPPPFLFLSHPSKS